MLQAMAYGGNLSDTLFDNVSLDRIASHDYLTQVALSGNLRVAIFTAAIRIRRLRTVAVVLRICVRCGVLYSSTGSEQCQQFNLRVPCKQGHDNTAKRQRRHFRLFKIWHLGLSACHGWRICPAASLAATTEETDQWKENACRSESYPSLHPLYRLT